MGNLRTLIYEHSHLPLPLLPFYGKRITKKKKNKKKKKKKKNNKKKKKRFSRRFILRNAIYEM